MFIRIIGLSYIFLYFSILVSNATSSLSAIMDNFPCTMSTINKNVIIKRPSGSGSESNVGRKIEWLYIQTYSELQPIIYQNVNVLFCCQNECSHYLVIRSRKWHIGDNQLGHSVSNETFFGHFCTDPFRFFFNLA